MPNLDKQPTEVLQIVKALRRYEHMIHQDEILYAGGDHHVLETLRWNIRCYIAIKEEMTAGVYIPPSNLQRLLSPDAEDGKEESYV